jgi:archaellum biogenesis protein FlaJ (TadC family)
MLEKAGIGFSVSFVSRALFVVCVVLNVLLTVYAVSRFYGYTEHSSLFLLIMLLVVWALVFPIVLFLVWCVFYIYLDVAIFKRRQKLEEVLPDFLQLVSTNIRAGMATDQALWFAVRPRFGILSKEIEEVAKRSLAGESLDTALHHFVAKYDSKVLERSITLLVEGIRAGGEIGSLLNKISSNIQETNILKKEMAANVMTYVIFITFATVIAAPFLFGMAYQMIDVIQEVFSKVDIAPEASSGFPVSISGSAISMADFRNFAVISLLITSLFSAMIVSVIKKGNVKSGIRYIPVFMVCSVALFFLVVKLFSYFVGGFF